MKVTAIDHLVLTTGNLEACLAFYRDVLGMGVREANGRYALNFGGQRINIHRGPAEYLPAAARPAPGSLDLCLVVEGPLAAVRAELARLGVPLAFGPVAREGAAGPMQSLYIRDPDGNLIELCSYARGPVAALDRCADNS